MAGPKGYEETEDEIRLALAEVPSSHKDIVKADLACIHIAMYGSERVSDYHRLFESDGTCLAVCPDCRKAIDPYIRVGQLSETPS